jgi:putative ABC transport system permease protein
MPVLELVKAAAPKTRRRTLRARVEMAQQVMRMALRNVMRNARRSMLSGAMVALGVAAVLFAKAYLSGLEMIIQEGVVEGGFGALQVMRQGYAQSHEVSPLDLDLQQDPLLEQKLLAVDNVKAVAPRMQFMGILSNGDISAVFTAFGIDPKREPEVCPKGPSVPSERLTGSMFTDNDAAEVLLGTDIAKSMNIKIGDTVTLLVHTRSGSMDALDATVVGTYRYDDVEVNKRLVVAPLGLSQKLLHMQGRVTGYTVAVNDLHKLPETTLAAGNALAAGPWPAEAHEWSKMFPRYHDMTLILDAVLGALLLIVFGLVLTGVVNTMLMSVFERTREIGTLMSMGFSRSRIASLFLCEAFALGLIASVAGAALGAAITLYTHQHGIPFRVAGVGLVENRPILAVSFGLMAIAGAIVGALAGGLWPAWRAAKLQPVEALSSH